MDKNDTRFFFMVSPKWRFSWKVPFRGHNHLSKMNRLCLYREKKAIPQYRLSENGFCVFYCLLRAPHAD